MKPSPTQESSQISTLDHHQPVDRLGNRRRGESATRPPRRRGVRGRDLLWLLVGLAALVAVTGCSLALGNKDISAGEVLAVLGGGGDEHIRSVLQSRVPRTLAGLVAGAGLAAAGTLLQGAVRNPLADPGLIGVNAGAASAVVTASAFLGLGGLALVWAALPGAFLAMVVVVVLGGRGLHPTRLILAGSAITGVAVAYVQAVTLTNPRVFDAYRSWDLGSLVVTGAQVGQLAWFVAAGLLGAMLLIGRLNLLALGDDTAHSLGGRPQATRWATVLVVTLLCGSITATIGPIVFIGLAVPQLVRAAVGTDFRLQLPGAVLLGPVVLLAADIAGRVVARPLEIQVGVMTALVGAPFLLFAIRRMADD